MQKNLEKNFVGILNKREGSGSVCQRYGSADPDLEHCFLLFCLLCTNLFITIVTNSQGRIEGGGGVTYILLILRYIYE